MLNILRDMLKLRYVWIPVLNLVLRRRNGVRVSYLRAASLFNLHDVEHLEHVEYYDLFACVLNFQQTVP